MQTRKSSLLALALLFVLSLPAFADKRTENIDIILAVDKSLSMAEDGKIDSVKRYVNTWLLDDVLIPGDNLIIIGFYGKANVIVSQIVKNQTDIQKIKAIIDKIRANGRFTDIGNALDAMKEQIATLSDDSRKKFVLMMTDGRQEAPPTSKYYSPSGKFNHEFLANIKTIQKEGWKIEILGIGVEAEVRELAQQLSGSFAQISGNPSVESLKAQTENLLGSVTLTGGVSVAPVGSGGSSSLSFALKSEGYSHEVSVSIAGIEARLGSRSAANILPSSLPITVAASGTTNVRVPVRFPNDLPAGKTSGTLSFSFLSGERFNPSEVGVTLEVRSVVENYWWLAFVALAVLAALVLLAIFSARRLASGRAVRFLLYVDNEPLMTAPVTLRAGGEVFLNETDGTFSLITRRNARSLARFRLKESRLGFDVLKADRFPKLSGENDDVLGQSFPFRSENGKSRELRVADARPSTTHAAKESAPRQDASPPATRVPRTRAAGKTASKKRAAPQRRSSGKRGAGPARGAR